MIPSDTNYEFRLTVCLSFDPCGITPPVVVSIASHQSPETAWHCVAAHRCPRRGHHGKRHGDVTASWPQTGACPWWTVCALSSCPIQTPASLRPPSGRGLWTSQAACPMGPASPRRTSRRGARSSAGAGWHAGGPPPGLRARGARGWWDRASRGLGHLRASSPWLRAVGPSGGRPRGGEAPVGRAPGQSRPLPGRWLSGRRRSPRPWLAGGPLVPSPGGGPGRATTPRLPRAAGGAVSHAAGAVLGEAGPGGRAGAPGWGDR